MLSGKFPETQSSSQPSPLINDWNESQDGLSGLLSGNFAQTQASSKLRNDISESVQEVDNGDAIVTDATAITLKTEIEVEEETCEISKDEKNETEDVEKEKQPIQQLSRNILDLISESEESESNDEEEDGDADEEDSSEEEAENQESVPLSNPNPLVANPLRAILSWNNPFNQPNSKAALETQKTVKPGARFVETEAEVEEDEFMNYGGLEGEEHEGQDQYDLSMLNDDSAEPMNLEAVLELHK